MEAVQQTLHIFGDQTFHVQLHLQVFAKHYKSNPALVQFFQSAYAAICKELHALPAEELSTIPRFTCVEDLLLWQVKHDGVVSKTRSGVGYIALEMAVTCLYQLATFISLRDNGIWDIQADTSSMLGICTGALSAAAVSCSRSITEIVPLAVCAVVAAFKTGRHVSQMARRLERSEMSRNENRWSMLIPGSTAVDAAKDFCNSSTELPPTSRTYISAYLPNGITISGPPQSLRQLTEALSTCTPKSLPIHGPYHAPHLYAQDDVDEIISSIQKLQDVTSHQQTPIISSTEILTGKTFRELLRDAVEQILLHPINWNDLLLQLQRHVSQGQAEAFRVVPIGTTADQLIYTALKQTSLRSLLPSSTSSTTKEVTESFGSNLPTGTDKAKLAIIGMSGRFPGARDNETFWDLLHQGLDMHKEVPPMRWSTKTHVDPSGTRKNTSTTSFGCWLDDPAGFDARFFNISPREAPQMDPAQRIALMTAYEAIEQAGIVPDATPSTRRDRVGIFYGVTSQDWFETNSAQAIDTYFIPGGNMAFIPGRINYFFRFSGPSFAVNTACSSSLAGVHLACNALWRGEIDTAIAGGTNILTNPDMTAGLDRGHFLSRTGNCKTFDDTADGYCRGEGVGTIILKRLDDALADGDPVLGIILGASTNHSAESESITRPHAGAQKELFNKILNESAVDPYSVGYVEMHGTGTQAGDAGEMSSVLDTFAPHSSQTSKASRTGNERLFLGSVKANIGHGEAASGMASLLKVLLMMKNNIIVPHCGIKTKINHRFPTNLHERNVHIATKPISWERSTDPTKPRRVFVNNFSAAGGNTALLIEDAPLSSTNHQSLRDESPDPRVHHVVAVSAKNGVSLQGNLRTMSDYLQQNPDIALGQLSYTTTARRMHHPHRVMLSGSSHKDLCTQIQTALQENLGMTRPRSAPKVVYLFTGQGAQYPGMGNDLYQNLSSFRSELSRLDRLSQKLGFPSFLPFITEVDPSKTQAVAFNPVMVQLSSVCMQVALARLWASWGVVPSAVVGHSLGEYAALNIAGVLSDADMIYLVGRRAALLREKCTADTHCMLVVKASVAEIDEALREDLCDVLHRYEIACINSPTETVITGLREHISAITNTLSGAGMKTTLLQVPYAFHSSQEELRNIASRVTYSEATIPVICALDGSVSTGSGVFGPEYLVRHTREPVNMLQALTTADNRQFIGNGTVALEIGPHPAVSGMVKATLGSKVSCIASLQRGRPTFQMLATAVKTLYTAGADIRWAEYHNGFPASHRVLPLPAYSWDLKPYWIQYVNDWSLFKGEPRTILDDSRNRLENTTIHKVIEESGDSHGAHIVVESDIARKDFRPLIEGHEVDGAPLCTPAVYADIALSLGAHILKCYRPGNRSETTPPQLEICEMTILKALILRTDNDTPQLIRVSADAEWKAQSVVVRLMSFDKQQKLQQHSHCTVRYHDKSESAAAPSKILSRINLLRDGIATARTARFNRAMAYRAIRPLARFAKEGRAVDEIVLDSDTMEATSKLNFKDFHKDGDFHTHPGLIDALTWAAGFSMNCNDENDLDTTVFVNHGWDSFRVFEKLDFEKTYTTYSHMIEGKDRLWKGEVTILDAEKNVVVARFAQFAMQGVPRRVLKAILSSESGAPKQRAPQSGVSHARSSAPKIQLETRTRAGDNNSTTNSALSRAMAIIAEESGLALSDLTDNTVFSDVGIDSLLGLTISARFKDELDLDLDFNALFYEYPTVGDLKAFLVGGESPSSSAAGTPNISSESTDSDETHLTDDQSLIAAISDGDLKRVIQIISEESGIAADELTDDTNFADCGVDSMLSLLIVGRFRDELDLEVPHETLFLECPTLGDLKEILGVKSDKPSALGITVNDASKVSTPSPVSPKDKKAAQLASRKKTIDAYVTRFTEGISFPAKLPTLKDHTSMTQDDDAQATTSSIPNVVLVTGTTGSLGGHLGLALARLPTVQEVICINREHKTEAWARQKKAMSDKGVHFPDSLLSKLSVIQTDTSQPMLGLPRAEYEQIAGSVTHIIHQAWTMSVKRPLEGFEPQFATMRNLIKLASAAASHHQGSTHRIGFQFVSSISVVGNYTTTSAINSNNNNNNHEGRIMVPEDKVNIDAVLPVGYAEAKWGCELMLDETLHRHPDLFRATTVRLGQIAGSSVSGYWNPTEHFGFLIRSSQTLKALPDVGGATTAFWTPVDAVAATLTDLLALSSSSSSNPIAAPAPAPAPDCYPFYHIENPVGQPWGEINAILASALGLSVPRDLIPLEEWTQRVRDAPVRNNPASALADFLDRNYRRMSCGGLVLDCRRAVEHSNTLAALGPVSEEVIRRYIATWKQIGFLDK